MTADADTTGTPPGRYVLFDHLLGVPLPGGPLMGVLRRGRLRLPPRRLRHGPDPGEQPVSAVIAVRPARPLLKRLLPGARHRTPAGPG
ncbi:MULTISPECIES: hypothetical protein [Streptomyces]|uniref:Uncharacterized protein n=1 Tax=Streptomyces scabiei (strain 87.22) TaxID=680198 RepID=C9YYS5_STRSW|nr:MULTISPECIES: hypothetical protein [Streptomyces]MBP5859630.1 hypothetical protein [Streptomyces sp. LBUM 1484]MBP5909788.1 hypothetical protein [Streptomyces sp. LBUM 1478]KFG06554.1 hypothetical protein IQ61_24275 [Streptomyces scabiei]MBP5880149.1 hypothetical protein [Streptomyces sp. LBUM 1477]MBP5887986.1 hypothetical protein [Streptomyces sp. LBUM 1487]